MTTARMHLYPKELPQRLRVELAWSLGASGALQLTDLPTPTRPSPLDPPFGGGPFVDVLLDASAHAPAGARETQVRVAVGDWAWEAWVVGRRLAEPLSSEVLISDPEVIDAPIPLTMESAFGGGVVGAASGIRQLERELAGGHLYPRNPVGRGYRKDPPEGAWELPLVEDPRDRLDGARLERIFEEGWLVAPLPWCLDEVDARTFPRVAMISGMGPDLGEGVTLPEQVRGLLGEAPPAADALTLDARFLQLGPCWAWHAEIATGSEVRVEGCLPGGATFATALPALPSVDVAIDGHVAPLALRLERVVMRPEANEVVLVAAADIALPRPFVPGLHRRIPIEVRPAGEAPIPYPTPTVLSRSDPRRP